MNRRMRARKTVVWGLACFVALQLGLFAVLAWGPWGFLTDPYYGYKAYLLKKGLARPERPYAVVMLGSSRTFWGLDATRLEQPLSEALGRPVVAFNFGQNGAGPASYLLFLRRMLRQRMQPDLVLIEIHPLLLAGQMVPADLREARLPADVLWRDELPVIHDCTGDSRPDLDQQWFDSWALPAYGHRVAMLNYLAPDLLPHSYRQPAFQQLNASGYFLPTHRIANPTPEQRRLATDIAFDCYREHRTGFRLGGPHTAALREILDLCRKEGLAAALVLSPEGKVFRGWYPPGCWEQVNDHVRALATTFGVTLIDAHDWIKDEDFGDSHHLLPRGAEFYTQRLGRSGILPLLTALGKAKGAAVGAASTRNRKDAPD